MTDKKLEELRNYIRLNPYSPEAYAYHLGLKDKAEDLSKSIEQLNGPFIQTAKRDELIKRIFQVCSQCGHFKFGTMTCDRKKSQCHSKRVRKWLEEIKRLEESKA